MDKNDILESCTNVIREADTAYLATLDGKGFPQVRAMLNLKFEDQFPGLAEFLKKNAKGFETYFTTNTSSRKIQQIKINPGVSVYYNVGYNGVTINGNIELIEDKSVKDVVWQDGWELYYPKGINDPDYAVLKFTPKALSLFSSLKVHEVEL